MHVRELHVHFFGPTVISSEVTWLRLFRGLRQSGVVPKTGNCRDGSIDCECLDAVCF